MESCSAFGAGVALVLTACAPTPEAVCEHFADMAISGGAMPSGRTGFVSTCLSELKTIRSLAEANGRQDSYSRVLRCASAAPTLQVVQECFTTEEIALLEAKLSALPDTFSSADYVSAYEAIAALGSIAPQRLPRRGEPKSSVFTRLVSERAFASLSENVPACDRLRDAPNFLALGQACMVYINNSANHDFGGEIIDCTLVGWRVALAEQPFMETCFKNPPPDAPDEQTRIAAIQRFRSGFEGTVAGASKYLTDKSLWQEEDYRRFATEAATLLPKSLPYLSQSARSEILRNLNSSLRNEKDPSLRQLLRKASGPLSPQ